MSSPKLLLVLLLPCLATSAARDTRHVGRDSRHDDDDDDDDDAADDNAGETCSGKLCVMGPFGSMSGSSWSDQSNYILHGDITAISLKTGDKLNMIGVKYGDTWAPSHGGWTGKYHEYNLYDGEYIYGVFGKHGGSVGSIDQIGFYTNRRIIGPLGNALDTTNRPFRVVPDPGCKLLWMAGTENAGQDVGSLLLKFGCFDSSVERCRAGNCVVGPFGGMGGSSWSDESNYKLHGDITAISLKTGDNGVIMIRVRYGDMWAASHGGWTGTYREYDLFDGEYIYGIIGYHGGSLDSITQIGFYTNRRIIGPFGNAPVVIGDARAPGDVMPFAAAPDPGCKLLWLAGRAGGGQKVDSLTFKFDC